MKLAILFSGGKDSNYSLYLASKKNDIKCLINLNSKNKNSYMFQKTEKKILLEQSKNLEIPIEFFMTNGEKEKELIDLKKAILECKKKYKIEGVVSGAIKSTYQSTRIQKICDELNLFCFNPLWQIDEKKYLEDLIKNFDIRIFKIACYPLTKKILMRKIDKKLILEFEKLKKICEFSFIGEGGEYESICFNSPIFKKRIEVEKFEVIEENENLGWVEIS